MTKAGEHYAVPLPFGKESLEVPNNRKQAMKRLMHLKDRYTRNPSDFANYVNFMHDLITKGYTRKDNTRPSERLGLSHTMGCITLTIPEKSGWSLIAVEGLMNEHWKKNC